VTKYQLKLVIIHISNSKQ